MPSNGYKNVMFYGNPFGNCTEHDMMKVREKCLFLIKALRLALQNCVLRKHGEYAAKKL